jgi:hypothetical protein
MPIHIGETKPAPFEIETCWRCGQSNSAARPVRVGFPPGVRDKALGEPGGLRKVAKRWQRNRRDKVGSHRVPYSLSIVSPLSGLPVPALATHNTRVY